MISGCSSEPDPVQCEPDYLVCVNGVLYEDVCSKRQSVEFCDCGCDDSGDACKRCEEEPVNNANECEDDECDEPCEPDCEGLSCGLDPICGESCGECEGDDECDDFGQCVPPACEPDCEGLSCGLDPVCGESCGDCGTNENCEDGQCICIPQCEELQCGDDGCGGSCGTCNNPYECDDEGQCVSDLPGWRLVWADEFNGPENDDDECYDNAQTPPMCYNRYWSREQCPTEIYDNVADLNKCTWSIYNIYNWMDWNKPFGVGINNLDPREVKVENGELILTARRAPGNGPWDCGRDIQDYLITKNCPIRSGAISSQAWNDAQPTPGFQQLYGRFEVRAILPGGPGSWPAHWMLPQEGPWPSAGEIDIMEATWGDPTTSTSNFHSGTLTSTRSTHYYSGGYYHDPGDPRFVERWHVYAAEWDEDMIRFYIDDLEIGRVQAGDVHESVILSDSLNPGLAGQSGGLESVNIPNTIFFMILNTSIVPTGGLKDDFSNFETLIHRIDYVRAYERCMGDEPDCVVSPPASRNLTNMRRMSKSKWATQNRTTHVGDFNGDGRDDLLLQANNNGHATYLIMADNSQGFDAELDVDNALGMTASIWNRQNSVIHIGDFNGDGADDILLQGTTPENPTYIILSDASGGMLTAQDITTVYNMSSAKWAANTRTLYTGDFDGDGTTDILLQGSGDMQGTSLLRADGDGGFLNEVNITTEFGMTQQRWSSDYRIAHVGDFDGNGRTDILLRGKTGSDLTYLLLANSQGEFHQYKDITSQYGMTGARWAANDRPLYVADFNGDGASDLLLQATNDQRMTHILYADGLRDFHEAEDITNMFMMDYFRWSDQHRELIIGDFNQDGIDDIIMRNRSYRIFELETKTYLLMSNPDQSFVPAVDITQENVFSPRNWAASDRDSFVGDFNGDGRTDILLQGKDTTHETHLYYLNR